MSDLHPAFRTLVSERPALSGMESALQTAYETILSCFQNDGKLLLCGNGGSACDSEHIAGELMKGFLLPRPLTTAEKTALAIAGDDGKIAARLQRALPTIVLSGLPGMSTAFANDVDGDLTFAQQAFAYARPGDVLLGISTSGNAKNVCSAVIAVKARGAKTIGLTGEGGGRLASLCDVCLKVPERETYRVQELHLPVYHALCIALETTLFAGGKEA